MHIFWLGNSGVKLISKPQDQEITILIDPYKQEKGNFPRNLTAQLVLYSKGIEGTITVSGNPFVISSPGECETKGVLVTSVANHKDNIILHRIDTEQMSIGHLGNSKSELDDQQLELLSGVDILFIPVGNKNCYDSEMATKITNNLEPRIIIPILFKSDNDPDALPVSQFLKEMGYPSEQPEQKLIIKKKDLPQEETKVMVLSKE